MPHLRTHLPVWSANSSQLLLVLSPFSQLWLHIPPAWFAANSQVENQVMIVHPFSRVSHGVLTSIFPVFSGIDSAIWAVTRQRHGDGSKTNCNYIGGGGADTPISGLSTRMMLRPWSDGFYGMVWMDLSDIVWPSFRFIYDMTFYDHDDIHKPWLKTAVPADVVPRQSWCDGKVKVLSEEGRHLEGMVWNGPTVIGISSI